jgi:hypothetical protein
MQYSTQIEGRIDNVFNLNILLTNDGMNSTPLGYMLQLCITAVYKGSMNIRFPCINRINSLYLKVRVMHRCKNGRMRWKMLCNACQKTVILSRVILD